MSKQVRVNIRAAVNAAKIRTEKRNGREVMIIPSATLPDGVVMNGIRYGADAIAASFKTLNRTLAPLGHPVGADGGFLSAKDPEAINRHHIGAWNENVRQEGGRVLIDKVIDIEAANATEGGKRVLEAIKKGGPIHTSTGLLASLKPLENDAEAKFEVEEMTFDHDAILLDEEGAATPEQGVGMLVNGQRIEVINSTFEDRAERELEWAIDAVVSAAEAQAKRPLRQRIKQTLLSLLGAGEGEPSEEQSAVNKEEAKMAFTPEEKTALEEKIANLQASVDKLTGADVANQFKTLNEGMAAIQERFKTEDEAKNAEVEKEKTALEEKVANAKLMTPEEAKAAPIEALRVLANHAAKAPQAAAPIFGGYLNQQSAPELADMFPKED